MPLVTVNGGELELLDRLLKDALSVDESWILRYNKNNVTPSATSVFADFTEADFTNYVAYTLTRTNWNASATVSGKAQSSYGSSPLTATCGSTGNTIYGYYVSNPGGTLLWAEKFASARVLTNGEVLNLQP